ncbi:hypothetical protein TNCV_1275801 [Trichonephila clavipes]|nr:hypothetical protein TNCV_1275801 [Trichonephila clavipes]
MILSIEESSVRVSFKVSNTGVNWIGGSEDAKINEETEENETEEEDSEEEVCGCKHFQPVLREMQGRRKDRLSEYVGFYDSLLEKSEMWEEGIKFQNGLGKDVWGIVHRYLSKTWWGFTLWKKVMFLIHFVRR